jgi:hypothetical protein
VLKQISENLWVTRSDQTAFKLDIGTRMTVVKLRDSQELLVHSPIKIAAEEINKLGEVKYVVIPNKWRKTHLVHFHQLYPNAQYFCAPDLEKLEKQVPLKAITENVQDFPWGRDLDHLLIQGMPFFNEVVFLHKSSKSLILADIGGHMYDGGPLTSQLAMKLLKAKSQPGWSEQEKKLYIRDRKLFEESVARMLRWDFSRVIVAHGEIIEAGGRELLTKIVTPPTPKVQSQPESQPDIP